MSFISDKKKFISLILVFVMLFTWVQLPKNIVYGAISYSGQVTTGDYTIGNKEQLNLLAQKVNSGITYEGSTFTLTNNIVYDSSIQNNYTPIGGGMIITGQYPWDYVISKFMGIFDGNGFYVSGINIYISHTLEESALYNYKGIFGSVENATIKNLSLVNSNIQAHDYIAGIAGYAKNSVFENCSNYSNIYGGERKQNSQIHMFFMAGGIIAYGQNVTIKNCINYGDINGEWHAGIAAKLYTTTSIRNKVINCINYGKLQGLGYCGGIAAYTQYTDFEYCINYGNQNYYEYVTYSAGIVAEIINGTTYYCKNYGNYFFAGIVSTAEGAPVVFGCENFANVRGAGIVDVIDRGYIMYCANLGSANVAGIVRMPIRSYVVQNYNTGNTYVGISPSGNTSSNAATSLANYNVGSTVEYGLTGLYVNDFNINIGGTLVAVTGYKDYASDTAKKNNSKAGLLTETYMKSQNFVNNLNSVNDLQNLNSRVRELLIEKPFVKTTARNNGYPIFWYQVTVENITIEGSSTINKGDTGVYRAIITPEEAPNKTIKWSISNTDLAELISVGDGVTVIVKGIKKGTVTLVAKAQDGSGVTVSKTITIGSSFISSEANYILVDEVVNFVTAWNDTEKDPLYKEEFKYIHSPNIFKDGISVDNTMGYVIYNNIWQNIAYKQFPKVGTYKIQYRVQDNPPTANNVNFTNYRYYSDMVENTIYVHRKPIALYSVSGDGKTVTDNSYDLDHSISYINKGIVKWKWTYVNSNGVIQENIYTTKNNGINAINNLLSTYENIEYKLILQVQDIEGAWSEPVIKSGGIYSKPVALFSIEKPVIIYPENQIITDMSYDTNGLSLTGYNWNVVKDGVTILSSSNKDISNSLTLKINSLYSSANPKITGTYYISLGVSNSAGIASDIVTKSFEVKIMNNAPVINFNLASYESPQWTFPKNLGIYTLPERINNETFFAEEKVTFNVEALDEHPLKYNWTLKRYPVRNISDISGSATSYTSYTAKIPFSNSFKSQGLEWGAYEIILKVTDIPPTPPYLSTDSKTTEITKRYYIVPEISLTGSFESTKTEVMVGDTIKLKAKTSKLVESVKCTLNGTIYTLSKKSEDGSYIYWERDLTIPDNIESGTHNLQFVGSTMYGGNGNVTREIRDTVSLDIIALKLINLRITDIVNHPFVTFPQTKDMLLAELIKYKAGYYVTFMIDSKGKPNNVNGRIDIGNNGSTDQVINLTKVASGDTETWQGRFYTSAYLPVNTVISIKLDCSKGAVTYDYNMKENWDGRSLITNGSALMDGRVNLTN